MSEPIIHSVFEHKTSTWQYVVADPATKQAAIIDPVLDYDPAKNLITTSSADALLDLVKKNGYTISRLLETHVHADHLTAANYLQGKLTKAQGSTPVTSIGKRIADVQARFAVKYGIDKSEWEGVFEGGLLDDDEVFEIGELKAKALHLPGHTPDHLGYHIGANVFCGDSLFNPDVGSARCDFPGGDAKALYASAQKLLSLPGNTRIYTGHDYPPGGGQGGRKDPVPYVTIDQQLEENKHLKRGTTEKEFVNWRKERDAGLVPPRLIHQSLQVNIRAGRLPAETLEGDKLLHLPLKVEGW